MARPIDKLSIELQFKDAGSQAVIEKLRGSLKRLEMSASGVRPNIKGLRDEILSQGRASVKSVSNINAQLAALKALRDEAKIGGKAFKQLTADIKKLDAQMAKGGAGAQKRGMGARRATQTAGAIISGGIFGGPEGAIGGALGAFGGVEGAFAGAAIGAQVGMLRQAVGDMADYAASIEKLKIALNGVLPNQNDFNFAIQAAQLATKELNIPQEQSIRGITRLSAAVTGAGGPVRDAASVFRNVTAAIKATGGSSEDVQGAITAMVQVFSKGKVSAEELSGQLGERLPGAVTMFAKANEMTLPELQKNLKAGTVGLNELMNFIHELGVTFEGTARQISNSNADAGARLSVAVADMQADIGAALIPIGSQFQAAFAGFIRNITPFLVEFLPKLGNLFLELAKRIESFAVAAIAGFAVFGAAKIAAIITNIGGIGAALLKLKGIMIGISLVNPYTALALGATALGFAINENIRQQRAFNILVREGSVAEVDAALKSKGLELNEMIMQRMSIDPTGEGITPMQQLFQEGGAEFIKEEKLKKEIEGLKERRRTAIIDRNQGAAIPDNLLKRFEYNPVKLDGSDAGAGQNIKDISKEQLNAALDQLVAQQKISNLDKEGIALKRQQFEAQRDSAIEAAKAANEAKGGLEPHRETLAIAKAENVFTTQNLQLDQQIASEAQRKLQIKKQEEALILRGRLLAGEITQEQFNQEQALNSMSKLLELQPELYEKIKQKLEEVSTPLQSFKDGVKKIFEEAMNLNQALADRGVQAVQEFGDAFADFVATGKANFKDFTVSLLQDLSRIFARAALFKSLSLIPGVGDFLGFKNGGVVGASASAPDPLTQPGVMLAANGAVMARNKIVPYAKGGIVKKPTFFQYANGGSGRFGLMGEAGPEAIMPLRRGRNGKLGVESSGSVGNVVVNVDASGSSVQSDQPNAKALGNAIGAAVQAELIKQKRPGGLLS